MKNFLLYLLFTALLAGIPYAVWGQSDDGALQSCHTGSWYDPLNPGEGISLEVAQDGSVVAYFYTYDGIGRQTWYVFQGPDGASLTAYDVLDREPVDVGNGSLTATSNDSIYFHYRFSLDLDVLSPTRPIPWCLNTLCEDEFAYTRLSQPVPCD
jgi:hypothetical protein